MSDDETSSIMLFSQQTGEEVEAERKFEIDLERALLSSKIPLVSRSECIAALDKALKNVPYEREVHLTIKVCGACSRYLVGSCFCDHCRCRICSVWKTSCVCSNREDSKRKVFRWMKAGYIQHTKDITRAPTTNCLVCGKMLSMLTAPYLRCISCLSRTL